MTPNNSTAFNALKTNPWDSKIAVVYIYIYIDTFYLYQEINCSRPNNKNTSCWKIAIETSTQASWSTKDGVNIWAPSFTICLRISWWPPSMAARRTSWVILENFVPPYLLVSHPPRHVCFLWCPRFNRFVHWHADLQYIIMEWCAIVEQHSYDIVI